MLDVALDVVRDFIFIFGVRIYLETFWSRKSPTALYLMLHFDFVREIIFIFTTKKNDLRHGNWGGGRALAYCLVLDVAFDFVRFAHARYRQLHPACVCVCLCVSVCLGGGGLRRVRPHELVQDGLVQGLV